MSNICYHGSNNRLLYGKHLMYTISKTSLKAMERFLKVIPPRATRNTHHTWRLPSIHSDPLPVPAFSITPFKTFSISALSFCWASWAHFTGGQKIVVGDQLSGLQKKKRSEKVLGAIPIRTSRLQKYQGGILSGST